MDDKEFERIEWLISKARCNDLTDWEDEFIDSISQQLLDGRDYLSDRQDEVLERIANK